MFEIEPNKNAGRWAVYLYTNKIRKFYEWPNDAALDRLVERHRRMHHRCQLAARKTGHEVVELGA